VHPTSGSCKHISYLTVAPKSFYSPVSLCVCKVTECWRHLSWSCEEKLLLVGVGLLLLLLRPGVFSLRLYTRQGQGSSPHMCRGVCVCVTPVGVSKIWGQDVECTISVQPTAGRGSDRFNPWLSQTESEGKSTRSSKETVKILQLKRILCYQWMNHLNKRLKLNISERYFTLLIIIINLIIKARL